MKHVETRKEVNIMMTNSEKSKNISRKKSVIRRCEKKTNRYKSYLKRNIIFLNTKNQILTEI